MSEIARLKRIAKSMLPYFNTKRTIYYNFEDAKMIINDLGFQIPAEMLAQLLDSDTILDDFLSCLYQLEDDYGKSVLTESSVLLPELQPKVYVEGQRIAFTVTYGTFAKKEVIFAEYNFGSPFIQDVNIE